MTPENTVGERVLEPVVLEYASASDFGASIELRRAFAWMFPLSILSGACVASCLLVMWGDGSIGVCLVHAAIYAATLACAIVAGRALAAGGASDVRMVVLDSVAGAALAAIGFGPLFVDWNTTQRWPVGGLAVAFTALAVSTPRHRMLYRKLASIVRPTGQEHLARGLRLLGGAKLLFESVWLACCAGTLACIARDAGSGPAILMAYGALFGLAGFFVLWLFAAVVHATLLNASRGASFDPLTPARP